MRRAGNTTQAQITGSVVSEGHDVLQAIGVGVFFTVLTLFF
jgi:hypothetical protein